MRCYFDNQAVLHVMPEDGTDAMAMRYWTGEYENHGDKVFKPHVDYPVNPTKPPPDDDD